MQMQPIKTYIIKMQPITLFFDTTKVADSGWKNADASKTKPVCKWCIYFFRSSLGVV